MKILIILVQMYGGVGTVVTNIESEFKRLGHSVEIISRENLLGNALGDGKSISGYLKLRKEVKKREYDILYTQDWSCALPLLGLKNHYCCFHGHNLGYGKYIQSLIGKLMNKKLFVVGNSLKKRFPNSTLAYNGVNTKEFFNLNKERKYIGYISTTVTNETIQVANELKERYGLEISIAKDIPYNKMNEWYNSLKYFVCLPLKEAGFVLAWLEAKASNVPNIIGNEHGVGISNVQSSWKEMNWENTVKILLERWKNDKKK